ncbi:MAG: hypothetical protein KF832_06550 [Caldilineaceae bacterium]|nr:hypothetical protein [Caldilineaceae bacterium]
MSTSAARTQQQVLRYVANDTYTQAILVFTDDSRLFFEHSRRNNRWARFRR